MDTTTEATARPNDRGSTSRTARRRQPEPNGHGLSRMTENTRQGTRPTDGALTALHHAIAQAARSGATYRWITGVLAACLAAETTTEHARTLALHTLGQAVTPLRRPAA